MPRNLDRSKSKSCHLCMYVRMSHVCVGRVARAFREKKKKPRQKNVTVGGHAKFKNLAVPANARASPRNSRHLSAHKIEQESKRCFYLFIFASTHQHARCGFRPLHVFRLATEKKNMVLSQRTTTHVFLKSYKNKKKKKKQMKKEPKRKEKFRRTN